MQKALYIPSYSNNKSLRYYDQKNRITLSFASARLALSMMNSKNDHLDRTLNRLMLNKQIESPYHGFDLYECSVWLYPTRDITQIQISNMHDIMNVGDMFAVIDVKNDTYSYSANLFVPNGPIIDVDYAIEIP